MGLVGARTTSPGNAQLFPGLDGHLERVAGDHHVGDELGGDAHLLNGHNEAPEGNLGNQEKRQRSNRCLTGWKNCAHQETEGDAHKPGQRACARQLEE